MSWKEEATVNKFKWTGGVANEERITTLRSYTRNKAAVFLVLSETSLMQEASEKKGVDSNAVCA